MPGAFIIAPPRSGTTLLRFILDSHPHVAAPPETHFLVPLLTALDDEQVVNAMWHLGFHRDAFARGLGDCGRNFLEAYAKSKHKSYWVDKTPGHVMLLPKLLEAFVGCKFLMLYRHPFDIVQSMIERDMINFVPDLIHARKNHDSDFTAYCSFVVAQHQTMLKFQQEHPEISCEVRYERLTTAPESELKKACAFLGVDFSPVMLDFTHSQHDIGLGDEKIYQTTTISPRLRTYSQWPPSQLSQARQLLSNNLAALGYSV